MGSEGTAITRMRGAWMFEAPETPGTEMDDDDTGTEEGGGEENGGQEGDTGGGDEEGA